MDNRLAVALGAVGLGGAYYAYVRYGRLSRNFTVWEMIQSDGGVQWPPPWALLRMQALTDNVLQPLRDKVGPIRVTSGYRTTHRNVEVGGSATSDHPHGNAVDVVPVSATMDEAWDALQSIPVDQAIRYPTHIHVGWRENPRNERWVR